ncbi:hypothetical protein [uncultured Tenacibaculum sp.]|uniref:hypothetical protein n=1 Tax=Tenacibaculum sp. A30 TaxID=3442644 RepID=UPI0026137056|nr:hypothetical protein [uncultured Tenacibaculum sp.]
MKFITALLLFCVFSGFSQEKFEREFRISTEEVPQKAQNFIKQIEFDKKVKWYMEESQDGKAIEAKSYKKNYKYSVEFDLKGNVLDVEKKIKWKEIESSVRKNIENSLKKEFEKFTIRKIQVQWKSDEETLLGLIRGDKENKTDVLYEIVLKGRKEGSTSLYEVLIKADGTIIKQLKFAPSNSLNLEF